MAYTSEEEIKSIIEVSEEITSLAPFITAANRMVTTHCSNISEEDAIVVETWLAAHFIAIRDPRIDSEGVGSISAKYQYKIDLGLDSTMYGQMAMQLDPTGGLADWNGQVKSGNTVTAPKATWLGSE